MNLTGMPPAHPHHIPYHIDTNISSVYAVLAVLSTDNRAKIILSAVSEQTIGVTLLGASTMQHILDLSDYQDLEKLIVGLPRLARAQKCEHCTISIGLDCPQAFSHLTSLTIRGLHSSMLDAVALYSVLAHMPRLEELVLSHVTFAPYEDEIPVAPPFRLRKYRLTNIATGVSSPSQVLGKLKGWTWPISRSAPTLESLFIALRRVAELQEAFSLPQMECLQELTLCGHTYGGFHDIGSYARFIARCSNAHLRLIALQHMDVPSIREELQLFAAPGTRLLAAVELNVSTSRLHPDPQVCSKIDAALADAVLSTPCLRRLRSCTVRCRPRRLEALDVFPLTRAVCAARRITFRHKY